MDVSGLTSVTTAAQMQAWLAANCQTPIAPVMTGSDFGAILEKTVEVSGGGGGGGGGVPYTGATQNVDLGEFDLSGHSLNMSGGASFNDQVYLAGTTAGFNITDRQFGYEQWSFYAQNETFRIWNAALNDLFLLNYNTGQINMPKDVVTGGTLTTGSGNLGGVVFDPSLYNSSDPGKVLIGWNRSGSLGETDFINIPGNSGTAEIGGFQFTVLPPSGTETVLLDLHGATFAATFAGSVIPGVIAAYPEQANVFLTRSAANNEIMSRDAATEVFGDLVQAVTSSSDNAVTTHLKVTVNGTSYSILANNA